MHTKFLSAICTFLLSTTLFAASTPTIHFATEATYPPFEFVDASGQIKGFDIDIATALCEEIKAQCTFTNQPFSGLIPSLQLGKFDALISSIGVTSERLTQVAFTDSYYEPSASFIAPIAKHYTLADINGKSVGVQTATTMEKYMQEFYKNKVTLKTYASIQDAYLDLVSGRIDLVLADTPIAKDWLKQSDNGKQYSIVDKPIINHDYFGSGYGIAVRKDNTQLLQALNQALATIKKNGTYTKIINHYFAE